MNKSTWLHLRIPFALYLLPIFCFAASQYPFPSIRNFVISFFVLHLFLYPATHGYNSYFDKDVESIGGLKVPPQVKLELYYVSLIFDLIAICLGMLISWQFSLMIFILGVESKAYSHPLVRLKKYSYVSLVVTSLFQGGFVYLMSFLALYQLQFNQLYETKVIFPSILCTISFAAFYPITQIYQHCEDYKRGDNTISLVLGIKGTFIFSGVLFLIADLGFYFYFLKILHSPRLFLILQCHLIPLIAFFLGWYITCLRIPQKANFKNAMLFNKIATICIVTFFIIVAILRAVQ